MTYMNNFDVVIYITNYINLYYMCIVYYYKFDI